MGWPEALRETALAILDAGVAAVEPRRLVREHLRRSERHLGDGAVHLVAVGKAAIAMARGVADILGPRLVGGVAIAPPGAVEGAPHGVRVFEGGHPIPNAAGVRGALAIRALVADLGADDTVVCLISGGGSALMSLPPEGVTLEDVQSTTDSLLRAGATIDELNCVRKHLDQLKGGRLAAAAAPARLHAFILSDVVGDPLDVIASGPTAPDPSTFLEAVNVLERHGLSDSVPQPVRAHLEAGLAGRVAESPTGRHRCFAGVRNEIVGSNSMAAAAAAAEAVHRGFRAAVETTAQVGEARSVGHSLAARGLALRSIDPSALPACLVFAGETTVTVTGDGRGGRNQELALAAAIALEGSERVLVASLGTDGIDGPTDAAGAVADGRTVARAREAGFDPRTSLADNDSYPLFQAIGDLIVTGPTGTNVMDLMLVLVADGDPRRRP